MGGKAGSASAGWGMDVRRDVGGLARWMGPSALRYREIADLERCRAAAVRRGFPPCDEASAGAPRALPTAVAFVSSSRGAGRTTLAAHLCAALAARGAKPVGIDLDPKRNLARALAPERPCLAPSPEVVARLHRRALAQSDFDPESASRDLAAPHEGWDVLVLDTGPEPTPALHVARASAQALLFVVAPEAVGDVPQAMGATAGAGGRLFVLLNGFDNRREDHRGALDALRGACGDRALPPVHLDPAFRERFGAAPHSQAAADVQRLAQWILGPAEASSH